MAIVNGNTVSMFSANASGPSPRLRGVIRSINAGVGDVFWENGSKVTGMSVSDLYKVLFTAPPNIVALVGRSVKLLGGDGSVAAQEMKGVILGAYVSEGDTGATAGHIIGLLTGRGDGSPRVFFDMEVPADFSTLPFIVTTDVYPRY